MIKLNKKIITVERRLLLTERKIQIEKLFHASIRDQKSDDESLDKSVKSLELLSLEEQSLELQVIFNDPNSISTEISHPDFLEITILTPSFFIDAATGEPLDENFSK